jgi:hypothetical protein
MRSFQEESAELIKGSDMLRRLLEGSHQERYPLMNLTARVKVALNLIIHLRIIRGLRINNK